MNAISKRIVASMFVLGMGASPLCSQALPAGERGFSPLNHVEVAAGGTGLFTGTLPTHNSSVPQTATDALGGLVSVKDRPVPWAGFELNYGYSKLREQYISGASFSVNTALHEATGAFTFHPRLLHLQPFVAIGAGYVIFAPPQSRSQWRAAGLGEIGLDIPRGNPHLGFRVQARVLAYSAPNFYNRGLGTANWMATTEPMAGAWYRF